MILSVEFLFFIYFLSINIIYTILLLLGIVYVIRRRKELSVESFTHILHSNHFPEITFVIPMYNEEKNICNAIESILNLAYRYKQIIAVNDGSEDNTLQVLNDRFDLVEIPHYFEDTIPSQTIRRVFRSRSNPEIMVIDKPHAGKFDGINVGINACQHPYFIAVDADTFIDNDGFEALIRPLFSHIETVAVGASVRIKNGCTLDFNRVNTKKISCRFLPMFQGMEYLRSFLQRQGLNYVGGTYVVAGAFSIFPTRLIREMGGFSSCIAEDMEVIVRLHRKMLELKRPYRVTYIPDPIAWTEGPSNLASLGRQRTRWHLGLLQVIWYHKAMCLNPRYGVFRLMNIPYLIWAEAIEPIMEAIGYGFIVTAWVSGFLDLRFSIFLILITLGFTFVYSLICLLVEEFSFKKYTNLKTVLVMFLISLVENFGYRQLTIYWRLKSFFKFSKTFREIQRESKRIKKLMRRSIS